jgi:hypothetical protein
MLTLEREKPSASPISSALRGWGTHTAGVDLADGAVDAPAAAHLAEVHHEALGQGWEVHADLSEFSVFSETSRSAGSVC